MPADPGRINQPRPLLAALQIRDLFRQQREDKLHPQVVLAPGDLINMKNWVLTAGGNSGNNQ